MKKTLIVNLIGGPGSGKSTCASGIFYQLKKLGINCELALEFAKDKVWEESIKTLDDQFYIFGKQYHKLFRLMDKVDVISLEVFTQGTDIFFCIADTWHEDITHPDRLAVLFQPFCSFQCLLVLAFSQAEMLFRIELLHIEQN